MTTSRENTLRIIGGTFRGRKIPVLNISQLRPTPDRVRETLFNWLAPVLLDAVCLDLFAGSGILSFEAISRGAKKVILVDTVPIIIKQLNKIKQDLELDNCEIIKASIPSTLPIEPNSIDIVFMDPPYHQGLIKTVSHWLNQTPWLKANALIYLEAEKKLDDLGLPENWQIMKAKTAGNVKYYLASYKKS